MLVKELREEVSKLTDSTCPSVPQSLCTILILLVLGKAQAAEQLRATQQELTEARAEITAAQEVVAAGDAACAVLQQQLDEAATTAAQTARQGPLGEQANMLQIPRPGGSGWSIRKSMQVTKQEYAEIQVRTLQCLVVSTFESCPSN